MRRDVSQFADKLDIGKVSELLYIPEHRITGALKRKTIQYVWGKKE